MDQIIVRGNGPLHGEIPIAGAKNACLTLMPATLLTDQPLTLTAGEAVTLGADIPVEKDVLAALVPGMTVLLDDGAMALTVLDGGRCRVTRGQSLAAFGNDQQAIGARH